MRARLSKTLRGVVQERAAGRCEYCLLHEEDSLLPHEPDHIVACKHGGKTIPGNLAWTCFFCNRFKGTDLSSIDLETGRIVRLFHPRRDTWGRHFRLIHGFIKPTSAVGRVTEYLLQLNRSNLLEIRKELIAAGLYPR